MRYGTHNPGLSRQSLGMNSRSISEEVASEPTVAESIAADTGELGIELPHNHSPLPKFEYLVEFLESLSRISGVGAKQLRLIRISSFIEKWRKDVGNDIFPAFQLILPHVDSDIRQLYNLKDIALARLLVKALDLNPKSRDAQILSDVRRSGFGSTGHGDGLAAKAEDAIGKRNTQVEFSDWPLDKVIEKLVALSQGTREQQVAILKDMMSAMNALEMKWVVRIILRNLQLNSSEKSFFQVWHPDALILFNVTNNLRIVSHQLWNRDLRLESADQAIRPLSCFKPMRSKFARGAVSDMAQIVAKMSVSEESEEPTFYIEEKIDGERIQLHWTNFGRRCRYFSRKGKDFTEDYGEDAHSKDPHGSMAPFLAKIFNPKVESCILDGEMAAWDMENKELCALSKVRQASKAKGGGHLRPLFLVFDCVYLNGVDLSRQPLRKRKEALERVIPLENRQFANGVLEILPYKIGHVASDIAKEFDRVIPMMSEGLIVKDPRSRYILDGVTDAWLKVKPEFVAGYEGENFDLLVAGAYRGSGKWANICSSYLCTLRDQTSQKKYVSLCRVGSGFCTAIYEYIEDILRPHLFSQLKTPSWLELGTERPPDFYVDPEKSVVFEIKATQITSIIADEAKGELPYGVGYSLRFPRFVRLREDKDCNSALTVGELLAYRHTASAGKRGLESSQRGTSTTGRSTLQKRLKVDGGNSVPVPSTSNIFSGLVFYIAGDIEAPKYMTKLELERLVQENGGRPTNVLADGALIISDRLVPSVVPLVKRGTSILHPRWIFDSILNGQPLVPEPDHYFHTLQAAGRANVDDFGFSLVRQMYLPDIKRHFEQINSEGSNFDISHLDRTLQLLLSSEETQSTHLRAFVFAGLTVYVDAANVERSALIKQILLYGSASLTPSAESASHVISDVTERSQRMKYLKRERVPYIVTSYWVQQCWRERTLLDEVEYGDAKA